jgi:hypothetical protein
VSGLAAVGLVEDLHVPNVACGGEAAGGRGGRGEGSEEGEAGE